MDGFLIALAVAIPVILIPAALIWYLNATGILTVMRETRRRRIARGRQLKAMRKAS